MTLYHFSDGMIDDMVLTLLVAIDPAYTHRVQCARMKVGWEHEMMRHLITGGELRLAWWEGVDDGKVHINGHPLLSWKRGC